MSTPWKRERLYDALIESMHWHGQQVMVGGIFYDSPKHLLSAYADEVRREADTQRGLAEARAKVAERKYAELRAAIQAHLDPEAGMATSPFGDGKRYFSEDGLRDLLADAAAALREVKAAAYDEGWKARDPHARDHGNPYRDTAGDRGWSCNKLGCSKSDPCSPGCYTMYKAHPWREAGE